MSHERYDDAIAELRIRTDGGLDDLALTNVQRRLRTELASRKTAASRVWLMPLTAGLLAAAVIAFIFMPRRDVVDAPSRTADVIHVVGGSEVLSVAQHRTVPANEKLELTVGENAQVVVFGPAAVRVAEDGRLGVSDGLAAFAVTRQPPGHFFSVVIGASAVTVHGTKFIIEATADALSGVTVTEGEVEVAFPAQAPFLLKAGDGWGTKPLVPEGGAASNALAPGLPVVINPAPERHGKTNGHEAQDPWDIAEKALERGDCRDVASRVDGLVSHAKNEDVSARAVMLEAECWLRGREKRRALAPLDRVTTTYGKTASAQSALFEAAKVRADLGMSAEAAAGFDAYLASYPKGTFAEAASFRRCEMDAVTTSRSVAADCLETHLQRFPHGRRTGDALLLEGSYACAEEKWPDASRLYWSYLERIPAERDDVSNLSALLRCLRHGRTADADRAEAAFKARHP